MAGIKPRGGYTIVEVMIFLAVSGAIFVIAANFISGKQETVAFRQAMNNANQQIQNVINAVSNGEFSSDSSFNNSFTCTTTDTGPPTISSASSANQGGNSGLHTGCTFLGKIVSFNVGSTNPQFTTYTVAARQYAQNSGGALQQPPVTFADAQPVLVSQLNTTATFENQLYVSKAYYCPQADANCTSPINSTIAAIGFFGSFNGGTAANSTSGAQTVNAAYYTVATPAPSNLTTTTIVSGGNYLLLCLKDGAKRGSISIGSTSGQQVTTEMHISINIPSVCPS